MIRFVFRWEVVEFYNIGKIRFYDVRWRHTSGLESQVVVVWVDKSNGAEDGFDFNTVRR